MKVSDPYELIETRHGMMLVNRNDVYMGQALLLYGECCELEWRFVQSFLPKFRSGDRSRRQHGYPHDSELGLRGKVIIMREVSDTQKERLFSAADIFLGPCQSMQESFGLTPIEAMASGLPQVVADWNGYRDTVMHGETGFLIPTIWGRCDGDLHCTGDLIGWPFDHIIQGQSIATDLALMYKYLDILINHPDLRVAMSKNSRARAVEQFSFANVARLYDELWVELSAMAKLIVRAPEAGRFDQPSYYDNFGHFATRELNNDSLVRIGNSDLISLERLVRISHSELPGIAMLDQSLLVALSEILTTAARSAETLRVGELISRASSVSASGEIVRRHILFLLKHGRVTVELYAAEQPNSDKWHKL